MNENVEMLNGVIEILEMVKIISENGKINNLEDLLEYDKTLQVTIESLDQIRLWIFNDIIKTLAED